MSFEVTDFKDETGHNEAITYTGNELFNLDTRNIPNIIDPIIPSVGIWAIVGSSDTGKSILLRQLALSIVRNVDFLNFNTNPKHNNVLVIATEDDSVSTSFMLRKQADTVKDLDRIRFYFETDNIPEYIEEQLNKQSVDLIIIDAWSDVFGQNLNDSALIRQTLNIYKRLSEKFKCSIGFLHHTGKRTQKLVPSKDNILSGQGFEAKMRLVMELRADAVDDDYKHLCIVKGNYLGKEFKSSSYKLQLNTETFQFSDTGQRVPFDELAAPTEGNGITKKSLLKATEVDESTHLEILNQVFENGLRPKRGELETRISNKYSRMCGTDFGKRRVEQYLDYLINDLKLIAKEGKDRSPQAYYYLTTPHITQTEGSKCE